MVFRETVECDPAELAALRSRLGSWLSRAGVARESVLDVVLVTHEAASNAMQHSLAAAPFVVCAVQVDDCVRVEVRNRGVWRPEGYRNDERGRGLFLMRAIASSVDVLEIGEETVVRIGLSGLSRDADESARRVLRSEQGSRRER